MGDNAPAHKHSGCGLFHLVFGRRNIQPRRSTSTGSLPSAPLSRVSRYPSTPSRKIRNDDKIIERPGKRHAISHQHHNPTAHNINAAAHTNARKAPQAGPGFGLSGELESMITDYQRTSRGGGAGLVRASSSNLMLFGNLGNLRQGGNGNAAAAENPKYSTSVMGNVVAKPVSLCRALSTRMDPEELKMLGNEDYRNGRFAEALSLYDAAISIDPDKASYRSNKSAALVALGKLLEAALECREAIRIDPFYQRAHNRLALIYLRLGEAERALYHFKQAGSDADPDAINRANQVLIHLNKCTDAKRHRDWTTLLKESVLAVDAGADSAPSIFGLRAEALLKMNKHGEAIETMEKSPKFEVDLCTKFFGPIGSSSLLVFQSEVHLVAGRFDESVAAAEAAAKLDPKSKEASAVLRKARAVAAARCNGNELFKAARYSEACIAYGEGLSHDPHNALLLCNRGACRSKLGQFQKAVDDCNAALKVRPSYSKARLRRADCYAKIGKWAACVEDCEALLRENPENEEIVRMMKEAEVQLRKGGAAQDLNGAGGEAAGLLVVASSEHFRDFVASSGVCVVLFSTKTVDSKILQVVEQLYERYPWVKFLKVEVEDHPSLAKSQGLNSFPAFIIYTNGSRATEIAGDKFDLLERSIKGHIRS
ncbi:inactive TPR repeat-containing thioredoxin TTL3-like [Salvia miltiorrhiza]|uniref:inactive TPR repeat-containing thioredoxin TTL3-like n=1 Tax=Salvia miltiorrhiza TaxID=226208 RepID=UPI0025ABDBB4|nr:inactive TPR repeat-containing thioredoxin TTL3-like [Salvia miltiorrhiza]